MTRAFANGRWFIALPAQRLLDYHGDHFEQQQETDECAGCLFDKARYRACKEAGRAALAAGLPNCESRPDLGQPGFIYVRDKRQPSTAGGR
jgi:hypothetical protein